MDELLKAFKRRMKIFHTAEDEALLSILSASVEDLKVKCGQFDVSSHERARELVMERSRYVYNDKLEEFDTNFLSQIQSLQFELYEVIEDGTTTY